MKSVQLKLDVVYQVELGATSQGTRHFIWAAGCEFGVSPAQPSN